MSDIRSATVPSPDEAPASAAPGYSEPPIGPWRSHRPRWIPLLRAVLLALVIFGLLGWLFLTPRSSSAADFVQDLQDGRVESYQTGLASDFKLLRGLPLYEGSDARVLVWCRAQLDCQKLELDELRFLLVEDNEGVAYEGQVVDQLIATYAPTDPPAERHDGTPLESVGLAWSAAWLIMLFVLITGPQPRRATKWAVVWIFTLSGGLGLLWALTREAPWAREASELPEPAPGPGGGRWTGGWAFIAAALLSSFLAEMPAWVQSVLP